MKESGSATASASAVSKPRRKNRHTQLVDAIEPEKIKLKHLVFLAARKNPDITDLQYYGEYVSFSFTWHLTFNVDSCFSQNQQL